MFTSLFAQYDYSYEAPVTTSTNSGDAGMGLIVGLIILLIIAIPSIAGLWKVFIKAGKPGWAAIVPFYGWWVWMQVIGRQPSWFWAYVALTVAGIIPLIGLFASVALLVITIIISIDLAKSFRKGTGMGVLIALLPFIGLPILGFGNSTYAGPAAAEKGTVAEPPYPTHASTTSTAAPQQPQTGQDDHPTTPSTPVNNQ